MKKRVVVTGVGAISGLGDSVAESWTNALSGKSGIAIRDVTVRRHPEYTAQYPIGQVQTPDIRSRARAIGGKAGKIVGRGVQLSLIASQEALLDSKLADRPDVLEEAAIVYGCGCPGLDSLEEGYASVLLRGLNKVNPMMVPNVMPSAAASALSMAFGIKGPCQTISTACASSAHAILSATHMISSGRAKLAVAGGSDAPLTYGNLAAWKSLGALSEEHCRPFSSRRDGTVIAEGAATIILEEYETARDRGATIYAEILGGGDTADAAHITQPSISGMLKVLQLANESCAIDPTAPALISMHGTGTPLNDKCEAAAVADYYGRNIENNTIIATKSLHGHAIGATAAIEFILGILAMNEGQAPCVEAAANKETEASLPFHKSANDTFECTHLISNSFAFGGANVVLVANKFAE